MTLGQGQKTRGTRKSGQIEGAFRFEKSVLFESTSKEAWKMTLPLSNSL